MVGHPISESGDFVLFGWVERVVDGVVDDGGGVGLEAENEGALCEHGISDFGFGGLSDF